VIFKIDSMNSIRKIWELTRKTYTISTNYGFKYLNNNLHKECFRFNSLCKHNHITQKE
jgi:hypothetical protein